MFANSGRAVLTRTSIMLVIVSVAFMSVGGARSAAGERHAAPTPSTDAFLIGRHSFFDFGRRSISTRSIRCGQPRASRTSSA